MVIFRSADGRTLTTDDSQGATGTFRYEIVGESDVPAEAKSLHQQGRGVITKKQFLSWNRRPGSRHAGRIPFMTGRTPIC
jgi:hypothetical protein